ncbi:GATA transcription factor 5-like [Phragmites australis]|uniref:GATA transcription factor 5-like n=1 Tax=Phragmites australis TaxID=29695 RepID=UPI002D792FF5|nr:GATA transcription factor 5-like [Phragmites australis]
MTHRTLISSAPAAAFSPASHFLHASSPSSPSLFTRSCSSAAAPAMASFVAHHHGSLVEREGRMAALRSSLRPYEAEEEMAAAAAAGPAVLAAVDRGVGFLGEGFSVEDLLDLEELCEVDKDGAEQGEAAPAAAVVEDKLSSDSHGSSVVSYELMPPPPPVIDLPLPAHDAEELEWVSRIMDDSLAELPPLPKLPAAPLAARRPLEGAVSAMDPKRSPTICALSTEALVPVKAKRSKRSRASVWSLSGAAPLSDSTSSSSTTTTSSCSSSASFSPLLLLPADSSPFLAAHLLDEAPRQPKKSKHSKHGKNGKPKKRGRKPKHHPPPQFAGGAASLPVPGDRRCSHCGVQKTPQWRAGPEGAKTLCNACGVRYKSGRLLPEYRPACSPTFVSSIHSNSHRKVLEMRRKKEGVLVPVPAAAPAVPSF